MKITITVPDKLFGRDITNSFQDFFSRVIADTVQNMNDNHIGLCGRYELETATFLKEAFANGAYNGEILTDTVADLTDRHWNECRQIALYDNELRQAFDLLSECYGALNALGTLAPSLPRDVQDYIEEVCIRIDSLREETARTTEVQSNE